MAYQPVRRCSHVAVGALVLVFASSMCAPAQATPIRVSAPATPEREPFATYFTAGIGLPELIHAEVGGFVHPRVSVDASAGWIIFNPLVGLGVTGYFFGDSTYGVTPRSSMLLSARARVNPNANWSNLSATNDTIPATVDCLFGYAFHGDSGFVFKGAAGTLFYDDNGFAAGPNFLVSLGYAL